MLHDGIQLERTRYRAQSRDYRSRLGWNIWRLFLWRTCRWLISEAFERSPVTSTFLFMAGRWLGHCQIVSSKVSILKDIHRGISPWRVQCQLWRCKQRYMDSHQATGRPTKSWLTGIHGAPGDCCLFLNPEHLESPLCANLAFVKIRHEHFLHQARFAHVIFVKHPSSHGMLILSRDSLSAL